MLNIATYKEVRSMSPEEIRRVVEDLRDRREVAGIKQGEVAKELGTAQSNVSALETGTGAASVKFTARYVSTVRGILNRPLCGLYPSICTRQEGHSHIYCGCPTACKHKFKAKE